MSTQELFDQAQERYRYARSLIAEMVELAQKNQPSFDERAAYCQFDMIVQYILLKVALADGEFSEIEGEFIDQITDSYDILLLLGDYDPDYDWSFVGAYMAFDKVVRIVNMVEKCANEHMLAFSQMFAEIDLMEPNKNYVKELYECIKDVASAFIMADGHATKKEIEMAVSVVRECLTDPWLAQQRKIKSKR